MPLLAFIGREGVAATGRERLQSEGYGIFGDQALLVGGCG
jgi:hypothetical protein